MGAGLKNWRRRPGLGLTRWTSARPRHAVAPVERRGPAAAEAAGRIEPAVLERPAQVDRGDPGAVGLLGMHVDFRSARRRDLAYQEHGHARIATGPLAGDLTPSDRGVRPETARRIARGRAVADRPRVEAIAGCAFRRGRIGERTRGLGRDRHDLHRPLAASSRCLRALRGSLGAAPRRFGGRPRGFGARALRVPGPLRLTQPALLGSRFRLVLGQLPLRLGDGARLFQLAAMVLRNPPIATRDDDEEGGGWGPLSPVAG